MTAPKTCEGCGRKPEAYVKRRWCYDCKPGAKGRPLPCRSCGATGNYWAGRLCRQCHPFAPQPPDSCRDCLAWGVTRLRGWTCQACRDWRHRHPGQGVCVSCDRELAINQQQACRLCWMQTLYNQARYGLPRNVAAANRGGQQLWFADMSGYRNGYRPHRRRDYRRRRDQLPLRDAPLETLDSGPPEQSADQPSLFDYHPVEDPARRHGFGEPPNPRFAASLDDQALDMAARHGWTQRQALRTRITLRVLLAKHQIAAPPIRASHVLDLIGHRLRVRLALLVLQEAGMLLDDRPSTLDAWFERQLQNLPDLMADELLIWFNVLHHGSTTPPRSRPRHAQSITLRTRWALPTLLTWAAAGHQSLREITRAHILAALPGEGTPRAKLGGALRSIFTTLKRHQVLFVNPTARLNTGNFERRIPMPTDTALLQTLFNSPDPATAAITALIGVHGLRPAEASALQQVDIRDHRILLADRTILLAPATKAKLDRYLLHRHQRWPGSINPHFLVHSRSASTLEPVRVPWLTDKLGITPTAMRQDRILAEVDAGGDHRRLCDFFGITITTAQHYLSTLTNPDLENHTPASPSSRTPGNT